MCVELQGQVFLSLCQGTFETDGKTLTPHPRIRCQGIIMHEVQIEIFHAKSSETLENIRKLHDFRYTWR